MRPLQPPEPEENPPEASALLTSAKTAAVAELAYTAENGKSGELQGRTQERIRARTVTPVVLDGDPAFTLTYADADLAQHLARNPEVCLTFTDSRLARVGWRPLGVTARLSVVPDIEGELYCDELMHQELFKFPPGRKLSNSLILRRENWWYLPRFILKLEATSDAIPLTKRSPENHAVLFWNETGANGDLTCDTVAAEDRGRDGIFVRSLSGRELPASGMASLYTHDFSIPDLEHRVSFIASGRLQDGRLAVESREGRRDLLNAPGLLARWREYRNFERRCRAQIEAYERRL
ncbi:MAG: hypothetical protein ACR2KW_08930 [Rubrobacter sp.]